MTMTEGDSDWRRVLHGTYDSEQILEHATLWERDRRREPAEVVPLRAREEGAEAA